MHNLTKLAALAIACAGMAACKVNKTEDGKLPEVNVSADAGKLPKYNVQGPEVQTGTKTETVKVPTVKVKTPN